MGGVGGIVMEYAPSSRPYNTVTERSVILIQPGCHRNGKFYKEGSSFKPSPCEWCQCVQGRAQCAIADCFIVQCVDSYNDPTKCCPVCPNGKTVTKMGGVGGIVMEYAPSSRPYNTVTERSVILSILSSFDI
jgi:hypothetical protein